MLNVLPTIGFHVILIYLFDNVTIYATDTLKGIIMSTL